MVAKSSIGSIEIRELKANSAELLTCARWRYEAFLQSYGFSLADSQDQLKRLTSGPNETEVALVSIQQGEVVGVCLLVLTEFDALHDVSPWLASLYVRPESRRCGIGSALVLAIENHARRVGVKRLYLYTGDAEAFYLRCGWTTIERGTVAEEEYVFMTRDLHSITESPL